MPGNNLLGSCVKCKCPKLENITVVISGVTDCLPCVNQGATSFKVSGCSVINGSWAVNSAGILSASGTIHTDAYAGGICSGGVIFTANDNWSGVIQCTNGLLRLTISAYLSIAANTGFIFASGDYTVRGKSLVVANNLFSIAGPCGAFGGAINCSGTGTATLSW